jgi:hypothetical protein
MAFPALKCRAKLYRRPFGKLRVGFRDWGRFQPASAGVGVTVGMLRLRFRFAQSSLCMTKPRGRQFLQNLVKRLGRLDWG